MAEYFLDSSALVKRYAVEPGSGWITNLTEAAAGNECVISALTSVEILAAVFRKVRLGSLTPVQARQVALVFRHELITLFRLISVNAAILNKAQALVSVHPLRASDAVQLATALEVQSQNVASGLPLLVFLSADQVLNQAATAEGLQVDDPNLHP
jgi:uncharacterized protein